MSYTSRLSMNAIRSGLNWSVLIFMPTMEPLHRRAPSVRKWPLSRGASYGEIGVLYDTYFFSEVQQYLL